MKSIPYSPEVQNPRKQRQVRLHRLRDLKVLRGWVLDPEIANMERMMYLMEMNVYQSCIHLFTLLVLELHEKEKARELEWGETFQKADERGVPNSISLPMIMIEHMHKVMSFKDGEFQCKSGKIDWVADSTGYRDYALESSLTRRLSRPNRGTRDPIPFHGTPEGT
ncbi:hypothetical protein HAX54_002895, partial [Datura stramonium]|nr:hypothetical protein [Datura stramonium]